jgi:predicted dithiol-disulfide oxidoreductase (DUF899 family)
MGWQFPYVSSLGSDFTGRPTSAPTSRTALAESPGWNVFALEDGVVYHTYSRYAPDPFLLSAYYSQLLDQVPAGRDADFPLRRHDEY